MMAKIKRKVDIELALHGYEIAQLFWDLDADQQAHFFDELARIAELRFPFQMQFVTDSKQLSDAGRRIMGTIGNYASKGADHVAD